MRASRPSREIINQQAANSWYSKSHARAGRPAVSRLCNHGRSRHPERSTANRSLAALRLLVIRERGHADDMLALRVRQRRRDVSLRRSSSTEVSADWGLANVATCTLNDAHRRDLLARSAASVLGILLRTAASVLSASANWPRRCWHRPMR